MPKFFGVTVVCFFVIICEKGDIDMNKKIGRRVELLIFEKGFPSIRKFVKYLREKEPENCVSEDTISNVIKGKGFQNNTLISVAKGLNVPVDCLMAENIPLVDEYLFTQVAAIKEETKNDKELWEDGDINNLESVRMLYAINKCIYPNEIGELYNKYGFEIMTLAELSIYFPLCRMSDIMEVMFRIRGQIRRYEMYIYEQYAWLYRTIPDIPAKKYADYQAVMLRLSNKRNLNSAENELLNAMREYKNSELWNEGFLQYKNIIEKTYKLYETDIVEDIYKGRLPELYG